MLFDVPKVLMKLLLVLGQENEEKNKSTKGKIIAFY